MSRLYATPEAEKPPPPGSSKLGCIALSFFVGGILLILVFGTLILYLGARDWLKKDEATPGMSLKVVKLTPTPASGATPTPFASPMPTPAVDCETIISSGDVQVAMPLPTTLIVGGRQFPVAPIAADEQGWAYPAGYHDLAVWACGSVVNYILGLEHTPENAALLTALRPGDEIQLRLSNEVTLLFRFSERREAAPAAPGTFSQARPRLTLILDQGAAWQIATADYVSESEPVQPPIGTLIQPGQPASVGAAQLTVIRAHAERNLPDLAPGTMYYLVELSILNTGATALDTSVFGMQLQDAAGSIYLPSPAASAVGDYGPFRGEIPPGATTQGTVGYHVPVSLGGPTLVWTFTPHPASEARVSVSLPYEPVAGPASAAQAVVTIHEDKTFLSSGGSILAIGGEIRNVGGEPLIVELDDISLTSSAGLSALRSAAPPLPWTIQPGQSQIIELQYEKPAAATVLLTVLGYSFEIRGL